MSNLLEHVFSENNWKHTCTSQLWPRTPFEQPLQPEFKYSHKTDGDVSHFSGVELIRPVGDWLMISLKSRVFLQRPDLCSLTLSIWPTVATSPPILSQRSANCLKLDPHISSNSYNEQMMGWSRAQSCFWTWTEAPASPPAPPAPPELSSFTATASSLATRPASCSTPAMSASKDLKLESWVFEAEFNENEKCRKGQKEVICSPARHS